MPINPAPAPPAPRRSLWKNRWLRLVLLLAGAGGVITGSLAAYLIQMDLPDVQSLQDYRPPSISRILAADGRVVHQFAEQKRIVVPLTAIDDKLVRAVVAVEDANFYKHVGVDPWAIARSLLRDLRERRWAEGGSTLTQQLTRKLFLTDEKVMRRKVQEALLAMQIEKTYTKEEIIEMYLNQIFMGHGRYGVEAASQFYLGIPAAQLSLEQAALLAGIIQRPDTHSPVRSTERAKRRRNHVLERMAVEGFISRESAEEAKALPVLIAPRQPDESPARYFAEEIRKHLSQTYGDEMVLRGGLSVRTGLDLDLQMAANKAMEKGLRELDKRRGWRRPGHNIIAEKLGSLETWQHRTWGGTPRPGDLVTGLVVSVTSRAATIRVGGLTAMLSPADAAWTGRSDLSVLLRPGDITLFEVRENLGDRLRLTLDQEPEVEGALLAMDPQAGDVRAMVGGFDFNRSQFNRALQAQRQCGSAFKPFIYALAIEEGRTASDLLLDMPTVFMDQRTDAPYQPENYERTYAGVVTLRRALEESINIPTVSLLNQLGYARTVEFAKRFGFTSTLHPYPSLALGSSEVTLAELVSAYGAFPTGGLVSRPRLFSEVKDREGSVLESVAPQSSDAISADVAAVTVSMMRGVMERGTAAASYRAGIALAGKTGTTDDYTDAWFIGYSPSLVIGVWVGYDRKVSLGNRETGARAALPIWTAVMDTWHATHPDGEFPTHPEVVTVEVDHDTGLRASSGSGCRKVIMESFRRGTEVAHQCAAAAHMRVGLPYYLQRYPITRAGALRIDDAEMSRLLRENPFHLSLAGDMIKASWQGGVMDAPLERAGGGVSSLWRFARSGGREEDLDPAREQMLPAELPPLSTDTPPFVGVDGRTALVVPIRYP